MRKQQEINEFIQQNSFDGGFLQSSKWLKFQEKAGRKIHKFEKDKFVANIIEHSLPIVGNYFYCPRGPIVEVARWGEAQKNELENLINAAKKENAGWIRIDPVTKELLETMKESVSETMAKAPHDMQPKEIFVIDITKTEGELLGSMKPKTRYNINLAKKKGVVIKSFNAGSPEIEKIIEEFLKLTKEMAARQGIATHPEIYYKKMFKNFSNDELKLYVAEYEGKIIVANLILFFGKYVTYLHGASSNEYRNVMAPFLLQWQAILDAKERGCTRYDFGGVKIHSISQTEQNNWSGITNFKIGFSPKTQPIVFPGSYDIIINARKYAVYRGLQRAKSFAVSFKRRLKK